MGTGSKATPSLADHSAASISRASAGASASTSSASSSRPRMPLVEVRLTSSRSQRAVSSFTLETMRCCSASGGSGNVICLRFDALIPQLPTVVAQTPSI